MADDPVPVLDRHPDRPASCTVWRTVSRPLKADAATVTPTVSWPSGRLPLASRIANRRRVNDIGERPGTAATIAPVGIAPPSVSTNYTTVPNKTPTPAVTPQGCGRASDGLSWSAAGSDCPSPRRGERQHIVLHDQPTLTDRVRTGRLEVGHLPVTDLGGLR